MAAKRKVVSQSIGSSESPGKGKAEKPTEDLAAAQSAVAAPSENEPLTEISGDTTPPSNHFPVVGIGSSAGGLEALQEFFGQMPHDSGMAFIVVTHQQPGHVSMLASLLSKCTRMPVVDASDGMRVEPNCVYVARPESLAIRDCTLRCMPADLGPTPHLPIDHFFRSLAADQREHAICIVLSGTGADGTLGLRAVKAELGMVMVQEPPSAKYNGMPASAIGTGLADYILPASGMPQQLMAYIRGPYLRPRAPAVEAAFPREPLQRIIALLRARTGHDFGLYKENTIRRRIERRMNVHQINEPPAYIRYLQENPHEIEILFREMLISVTNFFRDPEAFEILTKTALPALLETRADPASLRIWAPGCATGEEAYSLAILFREALETAGRNASVQVFGTDLDARAIEWARAGAYGVNIVPDLSKERLEKYFTHENSTYRIRKEVRETLIFASHDVIKDPPFTKLDMIACRNLLIYFDGEAQRRLLPVFHYALRPQGLLFLGPSETIGTFGELFETVDAKWKIYRRRETLAPLQPTLEFPNAISQIAAAEQDRARLAVGVPPSHTTSVIERLLLARFAPTTLVVSDSGGIVYIHGRTGAYLEPSEGQPRNNVLEMARQGLLRPLTAALRQAVVEKHEVVRTGLPVKTNGDFVTVNLSVAPMEGPEAVRGLYLITITPAQVPVVRGAAKQTKVKKIPPGRVEELEQELRYVKESLQTTIEELETSNEELKSTNEELQSTNEELQSANEELETSKEEMQSLNEELSTVNTELQAKVEDLSRTTDDMQNLLNNTDVAMIFLDEKLHVKRYTDPVRRLVKLIPGDVGRPLSDLASNLDYADLMEDCRQVLRDLVRREVEIRTRDDSWHVMRIMPYRTSENVIDGIVLTFQDIARPKRESEAAREFYESIVQSQRDPLLVLDGEFRVQFANDAFCRRFETSRKAVQQRSLFELGRKQWDDPQLRQRLESILRENASFQDFVLEGDFGEAGRKRLCLHARRLDRGPDEPNMVLLLMEDITVGNALRGVP